MAFQNEFLISKSRKMRRYKNETIKIKNIKMPN